MKIINSKEIFNLLNVRKKVSRLSFTEDQFSKWINTLNAINMLPEDSTWFNGAAIEVYEVPEFLSGLILPEKVTVDGTRISANLRAIETVDGEVFSHIDFNNMSQAILGVLKIDSSKVVKVAREVVNLTTVLERLVEADCVSAFSCVPISIVIGPLHKDFYYTTDASEALVNFVSDQMKSAH